VREITLIITIVILSSTVIVGQPRIDSLASSQKQALSELQKAQINLESQKIEIEKQKNCNSK
jgi:hypothetical protein